MTLVWTAPALRQLRSISAYIGQHDEKAADRVIGRIATVVERLLDHPQLGRPGSLPGTRELAIARTSYTVVYRPSASVIEIVAVFHQRQQR